MPALGAHGEGIAGVWQEGNSLGQFKRFPGFHEGFPGFRLVGFRFFSPIKRGAEVGAGVVAGQVDLGGDDFFADVLVDADAVAGQVAEEGDAGLDAQGFQP